MTRRRHVAPGAGGFTLLELLVAVTLLALLMAILFGGLRTGARVWEAGEQRGADVARLQAAHGFLRRQINALYPLRMPARAGEPVAVAFDGTPETVAFTGLLPAHFDVGGFQTIRVGMVEDEGRRHLGVEWYRFDPVAEPPADVPEAQSSRLIENIEMVRVSYFGADRFGAPPAWTDEWQSRESAPSLVRMEVTFPDGDRRYWPELIVGIPTVPPLVDRDLEQIDEEDED